MSASSLYNTHMMFCAICQEEKPANKTVAVRLPCAHLFCLSCFSKSPVTSCSLCRQPYEAQYQIPDEIIKQWRPHIKDIVISVVHEMEQQQAAVRVAQQASARAVSRSPPVMPSQYRNNRSRNNRNARGGRGGGGRGNRRAREDDVDDAEYLRDLSGLNAPDFINYLNELVMQDEEPEADRQLNMLNLPLLD